MKILLSVVAVGLSCLVLTLTPPALAATPGAGAQVFSANCAACHIGGGNVVNARKTLKENDLKTYGMETLEAVMSQVANGHGAMPAFRSRLTPEQMENVAAYVLDEAKKGW